MKTRWLFLQIKPQNGLTFSVKTETLFQDLFLSPRILTKIVQKCNVLTSCQFPDHPADFLGLSFIEKLGVDFKNPKPPKISALKDRESFFATIFN